MRAVISAAALLQLACTAMALAPSATAALVEASPAAQCCNDCPRRSSVRQRSPAT